MQGESESKLDIRDGLSCNGELHFANNFTVNIVGVAHNRLTFEHNFKQIREIINQSDFVSVETDISKLTNNMNQEASGFNDMIFEEAWNQKKIVICTDPLAETENLVLAEYATWMASLGLGGFSLIDLSISLKNRQFTRREFLKGLGISLSAAAIRASSIGDLVEFAFNRCEGKVSHPRTSDSFSYNEFRNSAILLGFSQLANYGFLPDSYGNLFIGAAHQHNLLGYQLGNQNLTENARDVIENNLYGIINASDISIRIWVPLQTKSKFELRRLPLIF